MRATAPILLCLTVGALGCGGSSGSQGSVLRVCQLEDLRVSTRAQGATGTIVGSIRLRNPADACSIATRADVSLRNAGGHRLAVRIRAPQRALTTRPVRLDGPGSNATAVVSLDWKEWCREEPGETTVTLRIRGSGELTGLRVFDGSRPSCVFNDGHTSVLSVSDVSLTTLSAQELG